MQLCSMSFKSSVRGRKGSSFITSIYFLFQFIDFLYVVVFRDINSNEILG